MGVAGKGEQISSYHSVRGADRNWMTSNQFYVTSETFAFVAITYERNGLSESKAVYPLKYLLDVSQTGLSRSRSRKSTTKVRTPST